MDYWFSSDFHFSHKNIIKYSNRPFKTIEEHDDVLISNFNSKVNPKDVVYFLGDFAFGRREHGIKLRNRLNGNINFIKGNHDELACKINYMFASFRDVAKININKQKIWLSHYAHRVFPCQHYNAWHLYGHSHGSLPDDPNSLSMDVGVDCNNYFPFNYEEIKILMGKKTFKPIDHHIGIEDNVIDNLPISGPFIPHN